MKKLICFVISIHMSAQANFWSGEDNSNSKSEPNCIRSCEQANCAPGFTCRKGLSWTCGEHYFCVRDKKSSQAIRSSKGAFLARGHAIPSEGTAIAEERMHELAEAHCGATGILMEALLRSDVICQKSLSRISCEASFECRE
jgi:hypothetical protein